MLYQLSYTSSSALVLPQVRTRDIVEAATREPAAGAACGRPAVTNGATPQNRTGDTTIFSRVLYQLS